MAQCRLRLDIHRLDPTTASGVKTRLLVRQAPRGTLLLGQRVAVTNAVGDLMLLQVHQLQRGPQPTFTPIVCEACRRAVNPLRLSLVSILIAWRS